MSVAKYYVGSEGSNVASTYLNSLANGSAATAIAYDNSLAATGDGYFYAKVSLELGSITPSSGGYITLQVFHAGHSGTVEDITTTGGDIYTKPLTNSTGAKKCLFMIRCTPGPMSLVFTNNSGVTLASSSNAVYITPVTEQVL